MGGEFLVKRLGNGKGSKLELSVLRKPEETEPQPNPFRGLMLQSVLAADCILKSSGVQVSGKVQKLSTAIFIARTRAH